MQLNDAASSPLFCPFAVKNDLVLHEARHENWAQNGSPIRRSLFKRESCMDFGFGNMWENFCKLVTIFVDFSHIVYSFKVRSDPFLFWNVSDLLGVCCKIFILIHTYAAKTCGSVKSSACMVRLWSMFIKACTMLNKMHFQHPSFKVFRANLIKFARTCFVLFWHREYSTRNRFIRDCLAHL